MELRLNGECVTGMQKTLKVPFFSRGQNSSELFTKRQTFRHFEIDMCNDITEIILKSRKEPPNQPHQTHCIRSSREG